MMWFLISCLGMIAVTALLFSRPLFNANYSAISLSERWLSIVLVTIVVALVAGGVYITYLAKHDWQWNADNAPSQTSHREEVPADVIAAIDHLKTQLEQNPKSLTGWLMLGRAYVEAHRFSLANDAYQHAYDLTQGQDINAVTGLAETLVLANDNATLGHASELIEQALKQQPNNAKALWYGGMIALKIENLALARERFKALLALNPPPQMRSVLTTEIQDLDQQLGIHNDNPTSGSGDSNATASTSGRKITVKVKLAAALQSQLKEPRALFILARDPNQGGPPLAVERHGSVELPLSVDLTTADAMLPTRTIATVDAVEVVARLSKSGTAMQQSGDYVGTAKYSFATQGEQGTVIIEIDHQVP